MKMMDIEGRPIVNSSLGGSVSDPEESRCSTCKDREDLNGSHVPLIKHYCLVYVLDHFPQQPTFQQMIMHLLSGDAYVII